MHIYCIKLLEFRKVMGYGYTRCCPTTSWRGVEVLMDKDTRSIGMPLTTLSPEVKRQLAKWGIQ